MGNITSSELASIGVQSMNRYGILFLLIIGVIGNILNVYVFSRPHLLQNNCVLYFLISSLFNLITLFFGVFIRCLIGYKIDLTYNSSIFCKLRYYCVYVSQSISLWLIVFACIDRYLSSSMNIIHRRLLNRKKHYYSILCIILFSLLSYLPVFYCFDASILTNDYCLTKSQACSFVDTASFLIFNSFLPPSLMLIFGCGMLMNIKKSRQRVEHVQINNLVINKLIRRDRQLISMLLLQVKEKHFFFLFYSLVLF